MPQGSSRLGERQATSGSHSGAARAWGPGALGPCGGSGCRSSWALPARPSRITVSLGFPHPPGHTEIRGSLLGTWHFLGTSGEGWGQGGLGAGREGPHKEGPSHVPQALD